MIPKILEIIASSLKKQKCLLPYWIKIVTKKPQCVYYFGPFDSYDEAEMMLEGYIEDLEQEKALGITAKIKRCQPTKLTIVADEELF